MVVHFFNLDKRVNSTLQATSADIESGVTFENVYLKRFTNIDDPTLLIDGADDSIYAYNYCYIEEWGRYYFVQTCDLQNEHIYECKLTLDDLATYKTQILATKAFILYSAVGYNQWIRDERTPIIARPPEVVRTRTTPLIDGNVVFSHTGPQIADETIIFTTYSKGVGIAHWVLTEAGLNQIMDAVIKAGGSIQGSMEMLFGDALGSIISAVRLPINRLCIPTDNTFITVALGDYDVQIGEQQGQPYYAIAEQLSRNYLYFKESVGIPSTYADYRVFEPYTTFKLRLPFVGLVDLSHSEMSSRVYIDTCIDLLTGKIIYTLYYDEDYHFPIATYTGQCGGSVPVAASQIANASELVKSLAGGTISLAAAAINPALGITGSIASIANAFYQANQKSTSVLGAYSGGYSEVISNQFEIVAIKQAVAIEPRDLTEIEGRPCFQVKTLEDITGFVQTQKFSISLPVNKSVIDSINAKLDAGIYIE